MLAEIPALATRETIILLWLREAPESDPHLDGIDSRIWRGEAGTGNMHKPHLRAPVVLAAQKMQSQRARSRKFTRDVPGGTCVLLKSVPPPSST